MGLLDGLLGQLMGNVDGSAQGRTQGGAAASPILQMALQLLQQNGGIGGLVARMQQAGYGDHAQSWIGTGQNQSISPEALQNIFGGQLGQIAQQLGMSHEQAAGGLAQALPDVVDRMTPQGQLPAGDSDIVAQALAMLRNKGS